MASKIRDELMALAKMTGQEATVENLTKLQGIISDDISDAEWAALSEPAQDWNNAAADAIKAGTDIPAFEDETEDEPAAAAPAPARRGRGAAVPADPVVSAYKPAEGDAVKVTTKRGKVYDSIIVALNADGTIVLNANGKDGEEEDDVELTAAQIGAIVKAAAAPAPEPEPEAEEDAGPSVGDTVEVTTKRGKVKLGIVKSIDDEMIEVTDTTGEDHEFAQTTVAGIVVKVKAAQAGAAAAPAPAARRGRGAAAAPAEASAPAEPAAPAPAARGRRGSAAAADAEPPKERERAPAGVGGRARSLVTVARAKGKPIALEALEKTLKAEGMEWRGATVSMIFKDTNGVIDEYEAIVKK